MRPTLRKGSLPNVCSQCPRAFTPIWRTVALGPLSVRVVSSNVKNCEVHYTKFIFRKFSNRDSLLEKCVNFGQEQTTEMSGNATGRKVRKEPGLI